MYKIDKFNIRMMMEGKHIIGTINVKNNQSVVTKYSLKLLIILQVIAVLEVNKSELSLNESLRWRNIYIYDRLDQ